MATSLTPNVTEALKQSPMPRRALVFFRERLKSLIHERVFLEFRRLERENKITKRDLARRLDKDPATITRLLGAPGNWTLDTVSDLLLGMGLGLTVDVESLTEAPRRADADPALAQLQRERELLRYGQDIDPTRIRNSPLAVDRPERELLRYGQDIDPTRLRNSPLAVDRPVFAYLSAPGGETPQRRRA
jgi:hypothetical protein